MIEMSEYLSPFQAKEGFVVGPNTELNELLTVIKDKEKPNDPDVNVSLLKDVLIQERINLDDLVRTAKQLNPVIQTIAPLDAAYDAAFESASQRPLPVAGATLQGFAILLLTISYVCLVLISVIAVNILTGSVIQAGKTLVVLLVLGLIGYAILARFG